MSDEFKLREIEDLHSKTKRTVAYVDGKPEYTRRCACCGEKHPCRTLLIVKREL